MVLWVHSDAFADVSQESFTDSSAELVVANFLHDTENSRKRHRRVVDGDKEGVTYGEFGEVA